MKLNDQWYDALKFASTIFLPALATLVGTIGIALGFQVQTGVIVTIITALGTFVGSLIGLSSVNYNKEQEQSSD